jgi:hypothetical protein
LQRGAAATESKVRVHQRLNSGVIEKAGTSGEVRGPKPRTCRERLPVREVEQSSWEFLFAVTITDRPGVRFGGLQILATV